MRTRLRRSCHISRTRRRNGFASSTAAGALFRRRALLHGEREGVDCVHEIVDLDREPDHVDERGALQTVDIALDHFAQGRELRPVDALQAAVRGLQREQRRLDVARELQLLRGNRERLLDLGQCPFVAGSRQLLVQRLERDLLILRFGEPAFERGHLRFQLVRALAACPARRRAPPCCAHRLR